ncbi:unnamed protein product [Acanthoscelides obtectus]|uniref:Uncharacterized protein n=1 Tax=Acanthoscelides obtectus TaxID=200917 RepID=A0A9P0PBX8_ACAOB|nr:unnamed protein product [Acanthoscelides obtectus]CAH2006517.1 unnamed protein product [Acanthoscelides obtectus]CAK1622332.1 hypothetical protein AOBTE_LOCUS1432 [Acanthoscelides obtectus]CAK1672411.1 hypothetical protein AOBTE_LOCUS28866 [Acanthoscelides obtectus]
MIYNYEYKETLCFFNGLTYILVQYERFFQ